MATAYLKGTASADYFGWSVAGAGDINNDGYDDVLVGAYGQSSGYTDNGVAYLLYGSSAGITGTITAATIGTTVSGAAFKGPGTNYIAGE
ncbi:MAG: hypothetical protein ACD_62C00436G0001, partial [uncultured bacterium]